MSPRPAAAKSSRPWQREAAGTYRSADGRFTLEGDGSGRWFVRDDQEHDELGLPRTTGPFPTLAAAKGAAEASRDRGPEPSPLAEQLTAAKQRTPAKPASKQEATKAPAAGRSERPRPSTWLETLEGDDREAAQRARVLIHELEQLGVDDAEGLVRRDVLGGQPQVAARLLAEALRRAIAARLEPGRLVADARRTRVADARRTRVAASAQGADSAADPETIAAYAVARTLEVALEILANSDRLPAAPSRLPGWELVERASGRRRVRVTPDDLA